MEITRIKEKKSLHTFKDSTLCPREEGVCCRRLEAVCVIDLALWLAVACIRAWSGTLTVQLWSW